MKLIEITEQCRRDFVGKYECEGCGNEMIINGYDDRNFHDNVMPKIKCNNCNKSTNSMGLPTIFTETKYASGEVV